MPRDGKGAIRMASPTVRLRSLFAMVSLTTAVAVAAYLFWPVSMPVPPNLGSLDASAEKGRYLATVSNCASCHTQAGGAPFAGGVAFHTPFGQLHSTNISSDAKTGIGSWSLDAFYRSMKHGVRPDGTPLYPAFPYTDFAKLDDADIVSIYLYLKTIAPVVTEATPNRLKFPFNLRFGLRAWNRLFHDAGTFEPDPTKSPEWNRGAYLVEGPGHCGACHTPRNVLGAERKDLALTGGVLVHEVSPNKPRRWSSVNLTPSSVGLGNWTEQDIVSYLKHGENAHAVVHGPMNEVVMNSTRHLDDADAHAIAIYLKALPEKKQHGGRSPRDAQMKAGEIGYTVHCGTCHLPTGLGDSVLGVSLVNNAIVQAPDPSSLINVILYAPHLPPPPFVSDRTRMKAFGKRLSAQEIADIASYLRASFGNEADAVTATQVERQR